MQSAVGSFGDCEAPHQHFPWNRSFFRLDEDDHAGGSVSMTLDQMSDTTQDALIRWKILSFPPSRNSHAVPRSWPPTSFTRSHYLWKCSTKSQNNLIALPHSTSIFKSHFFRHIFLRNELPPRSINLSPPTSVSVHYY